MLDIIFWIAVGAFIGWNFPQPWWAASLQKKIVDLIQKK
jgi:hypothetical protein